MTTSLSQTVFSPWLTPVRLVATSNVSGTYYNGPVNDGVGATLTVAASSLTIDSVVCNVGDRILLQDQSSSYQNGIYIITSIGSTVVLQRSADFQDREQMQSGQYLSVGAGSLDAGNLYVLIEPLPNNIGVDGIVFSSDPASGAAVVFSGPASTVNALAVFADTAGNIKAASTTTTLGEPLSVTGAITASTTLTATAGNITAGSSGHAGTFISFPGTSANGTLIFAAANAGGAFNTTVSNVTSVGQSQVISIPDCGTTAAKFLLDTGTGATATITKISTGATPVPMVDPGSCTIVGAAGASNVCNVTIQLKDGAGTNIARSVGFKVYASSAADGLTLASAASTGFAVSSGGLSLANGAAVTTQINAMSSATGGCVLTLTDTGKQTSYLVLQLPSGNKISAQLSSGSYGA